MLRRTSFALSLVIGLLGVLALAASAPAQDDPQDQATDTLTQNGSTTTTPNDEFDEDFEELEEIPEDAGERDAGAGGEDPDAEGGDGEQDVAGATDRNCEDFDTQADAQDYFTDEGGSDTNNVDGLDEDSDGVVCESLGAPTGGVQAGGGGTAPLPEGEGMSPLLFLLGGAALGLGLGGWSLLARRRRVTA